MPFPALTFPAADEVSEFVTARASDTAWPFEVKRAAPRRQVAPPKPEMLFALFAQALFSAPAAEDLSNVHRLQPSFDSAAMIVPQLKALVVDGDEQHRAAACEALRSLGFDTSAAANGDQALQIVGNQSISVMVLDWALPDAHGLVLAHAVRTMKVRQPLIIGLAGSISEEIKELALSTGFDHFCDKPCSADALAVCLVASGFAVTQPEFSPAGSAHQFPQVRQLATGRPPEHTKEVYQTFIDELVDEGQSLIESAEREQREIATACAERLLSRARLIGEPQFTGLVRALHRSATMAEWDTVRDLVNGFQAELQSLASGMQRALCSEQISA